MAIVECPRCKASGKDPGDSIYDQGGSFSDLIFGRPKCKLCQGMGYIRDDDIIEIRRGRR